jgi:hypothetical protein
MAANTALIFIDGNIPLKIFLTHTITYARSKCEKCCKGSGFYVNCVKPLEQFFRCPHDPLFPDDVDEFLEKHEYKENYNKIYEQRKENFWRRWFNGFK